MLDRWQHLDRGAGSAGIRPRPPVWPTYTANTTVSLGGVVAKYVKLTINSTWGGMPQSGLSEVQFFYIPVQAGGPVPNSGATGVDLDATLSWRPGHEAASHKVYLGTDNDAVANGTAPAYTVAGPSYQPASLQFGTTYYWKVNEVNEAATPSTWESDVWSFTTREYAVVDDFESYNDDDNRIYDTWIDGLSNNNGSLVGYMAAPFAEQTILHGGKQSMPLEYNNVKTPYYSEAERTWDTAQNWTGNGADTLVLYFQGRAGLVPRKIGRQHRHGRRRDGYLRYGGSVPLRLQTSHRQRHDCGPGR